MNSWGAVLASLACAVSLSAAEKKPIYVGSRVCGTCHEGKGIGHQYSRWLYSKHAMAYAALAKSESLEIVKLSGLRQKPQEALVCLGCHATASTAEDWEKDDTFRTEDGVQCEFCHGPGSEYMRVMRDRAARVKAGLRIPDKDFCMGCHVEKGSHVAVLHTPQVEIAKAWQTLAHPLAKPPSPASWPAGPAQPAKGPKFVGSAACGKCHRGPAMGYQLSVWKMSGHARAYASLGTPVGYVHAVKAKFDGDPTQHPGCLKCHTAATTGLDEGVGCEACHGAGSEYMSDAIMRDRAAAIKAGLNPKPADACKTCHTSAIFKLDEALKKIAHPTKLPPIAEAPRYKNPIRMALRPDGKRTVGDLRGVRFGDRHRYGAPRQSGRDPRGRHPGGRRLRAGRKARLRQQPSGRYRDGD